ncbi:hypothetical protein CLV93_1191, partial [Prolixibacter denitrificans]
MATFTHNPLQYYNPYGVSASQKKIPNDHFK